eukprot:scaffold51332_cov44-Attheya_sp.AAC.2
MVGTRAQRLVGKTILSLWMMAAASSVVAAWVPLHRRPTSSSPVVSTTPWKRLVSTTGSSPSLNVLFSAAAAATDEGTVVTVGLTREEGKNEKIRQLLAEHPMVHMMNVKLKFEEIPCIEHAAGPDADRLMEILSSGNKLSTEYQHVVITSPEAAKVFGQALRRSADGGDDVMNILDGVQIAGVGKATKMALEKQGIPVHFIPSQANGETLAKEFPHMGNGVEQVLYPASAKAADTIPNGLEARGAPESNNDDGDEGTQKGDLFKVTRLNTYDTVPTVFTPEQISTMDRIDVACFGSPSAVHAWLQNVDVSMGTADLPDDEKRMMGGNGGVLAACIGTTTAKACLESKRWANRNIYYPKEDPGMQSWADFTLQACGDVMERAFFGGGW